MTPKVGALMRVGGGQHWLVVLVVLSRRPPRYVCFRNGVRRTFCREDFR